MLSHKKTDSFSGNQDIPKGGFLVSRQKPHPHLEWITTNEKILDLDWLWLREMLRDARIESGYTLQSVGDAVGLSPQHICDFEKGRKKISLEHFLKYLQILPTKKMRQGVLEIAGVEDV